MKIPNKTRIKFSPRLLGIELEGGVSSMGNGWMMGERWLRVGWKVDESWVRDRWKMGERCERDGLGRLMFDSLKRIPAALIFSDNCCPPENEKQ